MLRAFFKLFGVLALAIAFLGCIFIPQALIKAASGVPFVETNPSDAVVTTIVTPTVPVSLQLLAPPFAVESSQPVTVVE